MLFYDQFSARYFRSSIGELRLTENYLRLLLKTNRRVTVNDFYDHIKDLEMLAVGEDYGWQLSEDVNGDAAHYYDFFEIFEHQTINNIDTTLLVLTTNRLGSTF